MNRKLKRGIRIRKNFNNCRNINNEPNKILQRLKGFKKSLKICYKNLKDSINCPNRLMRRKMR